MAYDPVGRQVILFSGAVAGEVLGDTWGFDGEAWTMLADSGPRPRFPSTLATTTDGVLLYGGPVVDDPARISIRDTWLWDGESWAEIAGESPPGPRVNTGAALDTGTGRLLMIGGGRGEVNLGDVWAWDGSGGRRSRPTRFRRGRATGPPSRARPANVDLAAPGRLGVVGFGSRDARPERLRDSGARDSGARDAGARGSGTRSGCQGPVRACRRRCPVAMASRGAAAGSGPGRSSRPPSRRG